MNQTEMNNPPENNLFVVDTMALILFLERRKLPLQVMSIFEKADKRECTLYIPAMVLAEVGYLSEKNRIDIGLAQIERYMAGNKYIQPYNITFTTIKETFTITDIPELHDRIIAATAKELGIPLITNDPKIQASSFVKTIWA
jgi:predicted nucleic acid-binding protein